MVLVPIRPQWHERIARRSHGTKSRRRADFLEGREGLFSPNLEKPFADQFPGARESV